jgi:hypothetical protein
MKRVSNNPARIPIVKPNPTGAQSLRRYQPEDIMRPRTYTDANADLSTFLADEIRQDSVQPHTRQKQCGSG